MCAVTEQRQSYKNRSPNAAFALRPQAARYAAISYINATAFRRRVGHKLSRKNDVLHAQSVLHMQAANRQLLAWSPQYQNRWRSQAFPRQHGLPRKRYNPTKLVRRLRDQINLMLVRSGLPKHEYKDRTPLRVQYHFGSVTGAGYARLRRAYRAHSSYSRWYLPVAVSVPFIHPFNRRHLSAKRFYKQNYEFSPATFSRKASGLVGVRTERKIPARLVPWRNFKYHRPKRGAPAALQR